MASERDYRPANETPFEEDHSRIFDYDVLDSTGNKVGSLSNLWPSPSGNELGLMGIKTGWLFKREHVLPARDIIIDDERREVTVPYTEEQIKASRDFDPEEDMQEDYYHSVYRQFGFDDTEVVARTAGLRDQPIDTPPPVAPRSEISRDEIEIPIHEEQAKIGKRQVEAGGVRLRKIVRTETINQPVEITREDIIVERVSAAEARTSQGEAFKEDEIYVPLKREEAVVEKTSEVTGAVRVRKTEQTEQTPVQTTVRKEEVQVERNTDGPSSTPRR